VKAARHYLLDIPDVRRNHTLLFFLDFTNLLSFQIEDFETSSTRFHLSSKQGYKNLYIFAIY